MWAGSTDLPPDLGLSLLVWRVGYELGGNRVPSILTVWGPGSSQALVPLALPSPSTDRIHC